MIIATSIYLWIMVPGIYVNEVALWPAHRPGRLGSAGACDWKSLIAFQWWGEGGGGGIFNFTNIKVGLQWNKSYRIL